ncbi:hypothetical protein Acr_10g0006490 [Actinidia rufa]|uniref:Uncharacterized protein n=1 Tax=Actinidia rufa TaxID=165716 RepID=A0A7J0F981_9ERIC|nr:hypothetical protein Acr_10g0006490 [Actinidia rufa]
MVWYQSMVHILRSANLNCKASFHLQFLFTNMADAQEKSRAITMALYAENKLGFIDYSLPYPTDPDIQPLWKRVSTIVLSWMLNSIDNMIMSSLTSCRNPYELCCDLESRFTQGNNATIFKLQIEITNIHQAQQPPSTVGQCLKPQQLASAVNPPHQSSNIQTESTSCPIKDLNTHCTIVTVEVTTNLDVSKSLGIQTGSTITYQTTPLLNQIIQDKRRWP